MKKLLAVALIAVALAVTTPSAQAFGRRTSAPCVEVAPCNVQYVEKEVICHRLEWKSREVDCVVMKPHFHEVTDKHSCTVMVPDWKDEKRTIWICKYEPREIEREVVSCRMVQACHTDPCTGCTYTTCKPEYHKQKVKCIVMEAAHEKKEIDVKVCYYKPEVRNWETKRMVCEYKPEPAKRTEWYCEWVPHKTKVMVPVCCP